MKIRQATTSKQIGNEPLVIINAIAAGNLPKAARTLLSLLEKDEELYVEALIISGQSCLLRQAVVGGRLTFDEQTLEFSRIANRILQILEMLEWKMVVLY